MSLGVNAVSSLNSVSNLSHVSNVAPLNQNISFKGESDSFERQNEERLTKEQKQEIMHKAIKNSAGWSIFGGLISTIYYNCRSDEKVAKKYNLDPQKDKKFIAYIKRQQTLYTIPSLVGFGLVGYIYSCCKNPDKIEC